MLSSDSDFHNSLDPNPETHANVETTYPTVKEQPGIPQSTKYVYTITSSIKRDERKARRTENTRPAISTISTPPLSQSSTSTPPKPFSNASTATKSTIESTNLDFYPDARITHHYTHCPHTSPPTARPLNVKPTLVYSSGLQPRSTLLGRCYECDYSHRRAQETAVLQANTIASDAVQVRLREARSKLSLEADDEFDEERDVDSVLRDADDLLAKRERDVQQIWKGFSARWGPGTIGTRPGPGGGRMDVKWIRP